MAKTKTVYVCSNCGADSPKWLGKCPNCGEWNTYVEEIVTKELAVKRPVPGIMEGNKIRPVLLRDITTEEEARIDLKDDELNRVLGGGLVKGSLVLIGGEPGIGKSTLVLQTVLGLTGLKTLYVSGEESSRQLKLRADRLSHDNPNCFILCETHLEQIFTQAANIQPDLMIIDSIQTIFTEVVESSPGSVSQVRECSAAILKYAKESGVPVLLIGHINKEGSIAGPKVLEHIVDTVLQFEGDQHYMYRILRSIKNRFGSTAELGIYEMRQDGLVEVENPSEYMLSGKPEGASGSVVACSMEGTRPILLEVQALVCHSNFGIPRRTAAGTDFNRVNLLMAVLEKRLGLKLGDCDAYVNIAGGIKMNEPAIDLGIVLALISSYKDKPIDEKTICFGEVGLSGEVRAVNMAEQRVQEAKKLGFEVCILPEVCRKSMTEVKGIKLVGVSNLLDAMNYLK